MKDIENKSNNDINSLDLINDDDTTLMDDMSEIKAIKDKLDNTINEIDNETDNEANNETNNENKNENDNNIDDNQDNDIDDKNIKEENTEDDNNLESISNNDEAVIDNDDENIIDNNDKNIIDNNDENIIDNDENIIDNDDETVIDNVDSISKISKSNKSSINNKTKSKINQYKQQNKANAIKAYDFEKTRKLSANNVKFLDALSVEFCKSSNLQLHHELKHENLKLKFNDSKQDTLSNFIEETMYNTVLIGFSLGRAKNLILKIDKLCALTFVECLLGGDGSVYNENRDVTEIDSAILTYLSEKLFNNAPIDTNEKLEANIENIFVNIAKFKTPISNSENLFISNIDIILNEDTVGQISICLPTSGNEGVVNDLVSRMSTGSLDTVNLNKDELLENEIKVINALCENKVTFDIVAELGKTTITVGELLRLDEDDVIFLNRKIDEPIDILVGGSLAYKAQPAISGLKKAIVIQDLAEKGEKIDDGEENN